MLGILGLLLLGGLGVPIPEDPALIATGALIYHQLVGPLAGLLIVFAGVLGGDTMLFLIARHLGPRALQRPLFRRLLSAHRQARIASMYAVHGPKVVFVARHIVGLRAAAFAFAGIHRMRLRTFLLWDGLSACISVPLLVGLGYAGALHMDQVKAEVAEAERALLVVIVASVLGVLLVRRFQRRHRVDSTRVTPGPP